MYLGVGRLFRRAVRPLQLSHSADGVIRVLQPRRRARGIRRISRGRHREMTDRRPASSEVLRRAVFRASSVRSVDRAARPMPQVTVRPRNGRRYLPHLRPPRRHQIRAPLRSVSDRHRLILPVPYHVSPAPALTAPPPGARPRPQCCKSASRSGSSRSPAAR